MRVAPKPDQLTEVYIDESSQTKHQYLVLGALVISLTDSKEFERAIQKARLPELPLGEAKWTKVSKGKLTAYKRMVDSFFDHQKKAHFHSLFVDTTKQDHNRFNNGSRDIGFNKEIYQLATKVAKLYPDSFFHLYPDHRDTTQTPDDLRLMLNRGRQKKQDQRDWPFRRCQFRNSKEVLLLQMTDILTGAIAFELNGHSTAFDASPAKIALSKHIFERAKVADVLKGTVPSAPFTIWPRKLR